MKKFQLLILTSALAFTLCGVGESVSAATKRASVYRRAVQPTYPPYVTKAPLETILIDVPYHRQEHRLSCEAATLTMVLRSKGVDVQESDLQGAMPVLPMDGDPNQGFVGNVDGIQHLTGYGIHADGLATVARQYRPTASFANANLNYLIDRLNDGNPVIVWGSVYRKPADRSWTTPDGIFVQAVRGEHTFVVRGYAGPSDAPTHIFTFDPLYGQRIFRTQDFLDLWQTMNNSGVVVE
jgi:uncharacterized protein YvpB